MAVLRLIRAPNLLIAAAGVLAGGWIALGRIAFPKELVFAALSSMALGAAGNTWNDIRDVVADRVNRPGGRPLAAGQVSRGLADLIVFYGAVAVGVPAAGIVPWVLAAWLHFVREIVKDVEDEPGDRTIGRRTLPIVVGRRPALVIAAGAGLLFVPASLLLPRGAGFSGAYFVIALFAQLAMLIAATWLLLGKVERVSALLKGAMVIGLVALVAGKVA